MYQQAKTLASMVSDFGLWTRAGRCAKLIADKFGANFGVTAVGKLLAKLGLTPQKPLKQRLRARYLLQLKFGRADTYPSLCKTGEKARRPRIYFPWDESEFRADVVQGTTWGVRGQTPVIRVPGQRQSDLGRFPLSMPEAASWFATYKEKK